MKPSQIFHNEIDDVAFIRIEGKGSFKESITVELYGKESIDSGRRLHVDLGLCEGMDSTFMGILAKLAIRQKERIGKKVSVVNAKKKSENALRGLGLGFLMDIHADWGPLSSRKIQKLRQRSEVCSVKDPVNTSHVYDAHSTLYELNNENKDKFGSLMKGLDIEIANEKK